MKVRESFSVVLVILAFTALILSTVPITSYSTDEEEPRVTSGPRTIKRANPAIETKPIHNPAGSEMFVAWLNIVPTCDGYIDAAEWSDANMYDISDSTGQEDGIIDPLGSVLLWLKQDMDGVYFAVRNNLDQQLDDYDQIGLYFDDNYDGCWPASATTEGNQWLEWHPTGIRATWRWWQDFDCLFPPTYSCIGDDVGGWNNWTPTCFGIGIGPTGVVDYEVMIPYGAVPDWFLDLTMPADSLGFFMYCHDYGTGNFHGEWPTQGYPTTYREPCYFGRLICQGEEDSLYWKPGYENYAPSGMPDIDMWQGFGWWKTETSRWTFDGPCALANCFKWFDSKYEDPLSTPGDGMDNFPLVRDYMDQMPWWWAGYDDHDPYNINDAWDVNNFTPWLQGGTVAPPPTSQPFIPGPQAPGGGLPPWGELVERIAWYVDLDGVQSGYCNHSGTRPQDMYQGIQNWLDSETFTDGSTLADTLCVNIWPQPTFELVEGLVEKCEDVILLLGFWYGEEAQEQQFIRGDILEDGSVDIMDYIICTNGQPFPCDDAADANDDGVWDMTDCNYILDYFNGMGPPPPAPFPDCGVDPTPDGLDCMEFPLCPGGGGGWFRVGGHWVTVAGINSEEFLIGFSDPFIDNAEQGGRGRVLDGVLIPHAGHPYDHVTHNDEGNVSHDVYSVIDDPVSPGGLWEIADYGIPSATPDFIASRFYNLNVPPEFEPYTAEWDSLYPLVVEVEYAIQVSPWEYRGDVNNSGAVEAGDVVFLIAYLYRGGPAPSPYLNGDVNCDGSVTAGDIVRLLNYLFRGWPVPRCCDP